MKFLGNILILSFIAEFWFRINSSKAEQRSEWPRPHAPTAIYPGNGTRQWTRVTGSTWQEAAAAHPAQAKEAHQSESSSPASQTQNQTSLSWFQWPQWNQLRKLSRWDVRWQWSMTAENSGKRSSHENTRGWSNTRVVARLITWLVQYTCSR